ncbi:MAG: type II toxin-antitoxin system prevent-host-death family antitoxin [Desulfobacterales bacterium]
MRASAKEMRIKSREILEAVARGEEVVITYRGKARAKIIRYKKNLGLRNETHSLFGIWEDNTRVGDVERYVRDLRRGRF